MLRIIPYLLFWMGLWSIYFPSTNLNPCAQWHEMGTHSAVHSINGFLQMPSHFLFLNLPTWKFWFLGSGAFALVLAIFLLVKNKRTQGEHEKQLLQKLRKAERVALRAQMNPHFIFNVLNSIQGFIIQGDKTASARYLAKFSKLVRTALEHSDAGQVSLEEELAFLRNYLELEQLRFQKQFDFSINVHPDIDQSVWQVAPMMIQPYIENAILHGLSPLEIKGHLRIDIEPTTDGLFVRIADNGIGIKASKKKKRIKPVQYASRGMDITKRRLGLLAKQKACPVVEIKELIGVEGKVAGTEVLLNIVGAG